MANETQALLKLRTRVGDRSGYRGVALTWGVSGDPVIRLDVDASADRGTFADVPSSMDGVDIQISRVSGQAKLEGGG